MLLGAGYFAGGGMAEEALVRLGDGRYAAMRRPAGAGRIVVELRARGRLYRR